MAESNSDVPLIAGVVGGVLGGACVVVLLAVWVRRARRDLQKSREQMSARVEDSVYSKRMHLSADASSGEPMQSARFDESPSERNMDSPRTDHYATLPRPANQYQRPPHMPTLAPDNEYQKLELTPL